MRYAVVIEKTGPTSYSAYSPDVPGCAATGQSPEELREKFAALLKEHFRHTIEAGGIVPTPSAIVCTVEVDVAVA